MVPILLQSALYRVGKYFPWNYSTSNRAGRATAGNLFFRGKTSKMVNIRNYIFGNLGTNCFLRRWTEKDLINCNIWRDVSLWGVSVVLLLCGPGADNQTEQTNDNCEDNSKDYQPHSAYSCWSARTAHLRQGGGLPKNIHTGLVGKYFC